MFEISPELEKAFAEIQMPRTPYQIEKFVVGQHATQEAQYAQCVLELQIKYNNLRRALVKRELIQTEIDALETKGDTKSNLKAQLKKIDLEELEYAMMGAVREFQILKQMWDSFPIKYNRDQLNQNQESYWKLRLEQDARYELQASGRITKGTLEALSQIGGGSSYIELEQVKKVEHKYLESHPTRILIVVPTKEKAESLPCISGLIVPGWLAVKYYNVYGKPVDEAYNDAFMLAVKDESDYILTVEDDTFPPSDALLKLLHHNLDVVGAWYPKREPLAEGTPIIIDANGKRRYLEADGQLHECYTLPMGCSLYKTSILSNISFPWFKTTQNISQDSFFSQKSRDAGYKLWCDTSIRCKHIDRTTGEVYE